MRHNGSNRGKSNLNLKCDRCWFENTKSSDSLEPELPNDETPLMHKSHYEHYMTISIIPTVSIRWTSLVSKDLDSDLLAQSVLLALGPDSEGHLSWTHYYISLPCSMVDAAIGASTLTSSMSHVTPVLSMMNATITISKIKLSADNPYLPSGSSVVPIPCLMLALHSPSY